MKKLVILTLLLAPWSDLYSQEPSISPKEKQPGSYDPSKVVILPHPDLPLDPTKTVIWCGTVQLAWNEMIAQLGGKPELVKPVKEVDLMNQQDFTKADLDEASYFVTSGTGGDEFKKKIEEGISQKFPDLKDFKSSLAAGSGAPEDSISSHAFMRKNLSFEKPFYYNHGSFSFREERNGSWGNTSYCHFGMNPNALSDDNKDQGSLDIYKQVRIRHYGSQEDYIIELKAKDKDEEILIANMIPKRSLKECIQSALVACQAADPIPLSIRDTLKIPVIDFNFTGDFKMLSNLAIRSNNNTNNRYNFIHQTQQSISFSLNRSGVKLESEAIIGMSGGKSSSESNLPTYYLVFDQPFMIIFKRRDAVRPYFAAWIGNSECFKEDISHYGLDRLIRKPATGNTQFYLHDRIGSVRLITDSSVNVTETLGYDAFGAQQ